MSPPIRGGGRSVVGQRVAILLSVALHRPMPNRSVGGFSRRADFELYSSGVRRWGRWLYGRRQLPVGRLSQPADVFLALSGQTVG